MGLEKLTRGDIITVAGAGYGSKPRPAVIIQSNLFPTTPSLTVCLFTSSASELSVARVDVAPDPFNNLRTSSALMADKIVTFRRDQVGRRIGRLSNHDMAQLNRALMVFLGLAGA